MIPSFNKTKNYPYTSKETLEYVKNKKCTLADIFNTLPECIKYNGEIGYMRISHFDIVYSSLENEMKGRVVKMWQHLTSDRDVFDSFYDALVWFNENDNKIEIL